MKNYIWVIESSKDVDIWKKKNNWSAWCIWSFGKRKEAMGFLRDHGLTGTTMRTRFRISKYVSVKE